MPVLSATFVAGKQQIDPSSPPAERPDDAADDLVDVLQTLQEILDWAVEHEWSKEAIRRFIADVHSDLGYAIDLAIAIKHFGGPES